VTAPAEELVRPAIRALRAYEVEHPERAVKLDANENPYPPPAGVMARIADAVRGVDLNRYPDPSALRLRRLIAGRTGWPVEGVLLGNGSDELISLLLSAFGGPDPALLIPVPTFSMYRHLALCSGWRVEEVPLTPGFELDGEALSERARETRPNLTVVAYPNNPTGNCFDRGTMERLVANVGGVVVVDEAYHDFAHQTFRARLADRGNLVILRTLSKVGLAALRIGVLLASPALVRELNKVRLPYNVSTFSQLAAEAVLEEPGFLDEQVATVLAERARLFRELGRVRGVELFPSDANFVLFRTPRPSREVFEALRAGGVLIRDLGGAAGLLHRCLRVTVGTPAENSAFLDAFRSLA
jgi:histidinol-phosphate aminotransferase